MRTESTAKDIAVRRMVEGQIMPMGVTHPQLLEAFRRVSRAAFLGPAQRGYGYADMDSPLIFGEDTPPARRYLLAPATLARLLQAAAPQASDLVLDVGGGTGYGAAILCGLVSAVIALECEESLAARARTLWHEQGLYTISGACAPLENGYPAHSPYDLIVVHGALGCGHEGTTTIPLPLLEQLAPNGRLVALRARPDVQAGSRAGVAILIRRTSPTEFSSIDLFDTATPLLPTG